MTKTIAQKRTGKDIRFGIGFGLLSLALISLAAIVASGDDSPTLRYLTFVVGFAGAIMITVNA